MKIIHIESQPVFAHGMKLIVENEMPEVNWLIGSCLDDMYELLEMQSDVAFVLLGCSLSGLNVIDVLRTLRLRKYSFPVALFTASEDLVGLKETLQEGVLGFIPKSYSRENVLSAIQILLQGKSFIPPEYKKKLERINKRDSEKKQKLARAHYLRDKQLEVLFLMQHGYANAAMAEKLGVSDNAIKYHVKILYRSFGVSNRVECIRYAEDKGLI